MNVLKKPGVCAGWLILIFAVTLFAQTTGKIAGRVTDARNGSALVGANVMLQGTTRGAVTDANGDFFLINIAPGAYALRVRMLGYEAAIVQSISVSVNRTTTLPIKLHETAIAGEEVVVKADRIASKKDQTSSIRNVSSDQIKDLPVENLQAVVQMQAGIVQGHFRGGRLDEVAYMVDGIQVDESFNRGRAVTLEKEVVSEVEVITGTFNAEYGNAMSGIVNAVTKDGSNEWHATAAANLSNYFTPHKDIFIGLTDGQLARNQDYKLLLSGPLYKNKLTFLVNTRYQDNKNHLSGVRRFRVDDFSDFSQHDPTQWYSERSGDSAFVPMNWEKSGSLFGKITAKLGGNIKTSLSYSLNDGKGQTYAHEWKYVPDGRSTSYSRSELFALQTNHSVSNSIFYELKISHLQTRSNYYAFKNSADARYVHEDYSRNDGPGFLTGGNDKSYLRRTNESLSGKWDVTWQANKRHILKSGIAMTLHDLDNYSNSIRNFYYGKDYQFDFVYDSMAHKRRYLYYRPVLAPDSSIYADAYHVKPTEASAYLQDKMEYDNMVINLGVRFDYFNPETTYPTVIRNPSNQQRFPNNPEKMSQFPKAPATTQLSPRLGISYKLGDAALLRFAYGHFFQMPPLYALYANSKRLVPPTDFSTTMGNPVIKPQKTIQYEVGLWQQVRPGMSIEVAVFYRDIYDLLSARVITTFNQIRYGLYANKDYGNARGLELKYQALAGPVSAEVNYTLQYTRGNADDPTFSFNRAGQSMDPVNILIPMSWDQRHTLNIAVGVNTAAYGATLIGYYNSGTPYTWDPIAESALKRINLTPNNSSKPPQTSLDLRAFWSIYRDRHVSVRVLCTVYNLLDALNEVSVNSITGRAYSDIVRESQLLGHRSDFNDYYDRIHDPSMYAAPRQIKAGLEVMF
jgi:outer membrane receptor protein involved in Fe transport